MKSKAADELAHKELGEIRREVATTTEEIGKLRGQIINDVLAVELITFDDGRAVARNFPVPFGSVAVANHSEDEEVTVSAGPIGPAAPVQGTGVQVVAAGRAAVINLASTSLTLYGAEGDRVSVQVFSKSQPPSFGSA